jgi:Flp pilus assembly protein TadB
MPRPTPTSRTTRAVAATPAPAPGTESGVRFSVVNAVLLAAGLAVIVAGYALLGQGSTTAAPLLLVLGYVFLIPLAIFR